MKRLLLTIALVLGLSTAAWAILFTNLNQGATAGVLTLTNLTNGSRSAAGTAYDPRVGQAGLGYIYVTVECFLTYANPPTAGAGLDIWFLKNISPTGGTFEDTTTQRLPDLTCPSNSTQAGTRVILTKRLEPVRFQALALNNGSNQTISNGTITILPFTTQGN
jgi:hypothetical protein